jgi:hypothetical protein
MSKRSSFILLLLTLSLSLPRSLLQADDFFAVKDKIIGEKNFKLGFLYVTPLIMLENVGYTSSVYTYEKEDHPDWSGDFGLGLKASAILANRLILQAWDLPNYSFYLENENLRSWSNRFSSAAYSHAGPFNFKAGFQRNDLRQRPQLEFSRPYHFSDSRWTGEIDFGRTSDLFLTAYAAFSEIAYDEDPYLEDYNLADSLNHKEQLFGIKLNKHIFTSTLVYATAERSRFDFAARAERDTTANKFAVGVDFPEIGILRGGFQIGIKRFQPANPLFLDLTRLNGRGDVSLTLMERLRLSVFYRMDTHFSFGANDLFFDNQAFGGGIEIYLTRFLKGGANFQDGRLRYHSFLDLELKRSDRVRNQRYFLAVPFVGNTSLGFSYNVYRLTSDQLGLDYTRNYWGGFISYEF